MSIKNYYKIAKPGMVYGNAITVIGGFILASGGIIRMWSFVAALVGISLVIASGCVFNNYIDRDIDAKMERTKSRPLVTGRISERNAFIYGAVLGLIGFFVLVLYTNLLATVIAALGFFFYVFMYSMWFKRRTMYATLIGSIAGAVPPVVGYAATSGRIDAAAVILFAIMVVWQMPHFFAIAIRGADEYAAAKILAMPVVRGVRATKIQMFFYIIAFIVIAPFLSIFGYTGRAYLSVALLLGFAWLALCLQGFRFPDTPTGTVSAANVRWAREMFLASLIVLVVLFSTMAVGAIL